MIYTILLVIVIIVVSVNIILAFITIRNNKKQTFLSQHKIELKEWVLSEGGAIYKKDELTYDTRINAYVKKEDNVNVVVFVKATSDNREELI